MKKILLIEDDEIMSELIAEFLAEKKHQIDIANSGETALKKLQNNSYFLILIDANLPDFDSFEIVKNFPKITSVMITGSEDETLKIKAKKAGVKFFIVKDTAMNFLSKINEIINETKQGI